MNTWLRDAAHYRAQFLPSTKVIRVLTKNNTATGVECLVNYERPVTIQASQVIVAAGSLQSPGVLLRSGLKNKHIGKHLRLHPCSITFGFFDRDIRTFEGSIMTAVSNVAENVDNEGYGAKLEVPCLHPGSFSTVLPWRGTAAHKELMMRYHRCAPILILSRDKDSTGVVRYDNQENVVVDWQLSTHDRLSLMAGIERSLNILVAAGARELHTGQFGVEPFVFEQGEESRVDNQRFIAWKQQVIKYGFPQDGAGVFCAHQMGTNRMGISQKNSVVKPTGETWEVKDLYVADASVFPTATGVNPMVTVEAIALHIADCILTKNSQSKL
jgi:choline dehydrogenase-like flavoprotein